MTISLTLHPQEEARLIAAAQARGISPDALVREALDGFAVDFERLGRTPIESDSR